MRVKGIEMIIFYKLLGFTLLLVPFIIIGILAYITEGIQAVLVVFGCLSFILMPILGSNLLSKAEYLRKQKEKDIKNDII